MNNRDEMFAELVNILVEEFDLDSTSITMDANLYEELDLDSIDTVDLVLRLQDLTGTKIEPERNFQFHFLCEQTLPGLFTGCRETPHRSPGEFFGRSAFGDYT